jgi:hypothetical protein
MGLLSTMRFDFRHLRLALGTGLPCCSGPAALAAFAASRPSPIAAAPPPGRRCGASTIFACPLDEHCSSRSCASTVVALLLGPPRGTSTAIGSAAPAAFAALLSQPPSPSESAGVHLRSSLAPRRGAAHPDHALRLWSAPPRPRAGPALLRCQWACCPSHLCHPSPIAAAWAHPAMPRGDRPCAYDLRPSPRETHLPRPCASTVVVLASLSSRC